MAYPIRQWTETEFSGAREAWNDLLGRSRADPLFMTWEWQHAWWKAFGGSSALELFILAAYDQHGRLVGVAPLFRRKSKVKNLVKVSRVEIIGNVYRGPCTMRTQHVDFIMQEDKADEIGEAFISYLLDRGDWDETAISDTKVDSAIARALQRSALLDELYVRYSPSFVSYYIDTTGSFEDYLSRRGKNTRLQMYNRRKQLHRLGKVEFRRCEGDWQGFFEKLNRLHKLRWGYEAFTGNAYEFNMRVAMELGNERKTNFSELTLDGEPLSVLYNYRIGGQEYFIQGGFKEGFDKKLQLGFLHLGYAIEDAFSNRAIKRFNLLPGNGKNTSYKPRLTPTYDAITETQLIKAPVLKLAYRAYDALRNRSDPLQSDPQLAE